MTSGKLSIRFSEIDVSNPEKVAPFIQWLHEGDLPEDIELEDMQITPERQIEIDWDLQAPKRRTAKLLLQLLMENSTEDFFRQRFTINPWSLAEDVKRSGDVLPPIQERAVEGNA